MDNRTQLTFLALIVVQAFHSVEEYVFRLYDVFPPARLLSGLISKDLHAGFIVINVTLVTSGVWCWLIPIRHNHSTARGLAWFWVLLELINGIGHPAWAMTERAYVPGAATAPLLFILALYLARRLWLYRTERH